MTGTIAVGPVWIATVDEHWGRLFGGTRTRHGRVHLDEVAAIQENRMAPQQAGMPVAAGESAHVQHFARLVAVWLEKEAQRHQAGCVHLLAEKHIMVALRDACSPLLRRMVRERTGPFRSGGARELAADPAVGALVPGPRQESRS